MEFSKEDRAQLLEMVAEKKNTKGIRRNLADKIIVAEGQNDAIELGDLLEAREDRKGGKVA